MKASLLTGFFLPKILMEIFYEVRCLFGNTSTMVFQYEEHRKEGSTRQY